MARVNMVKIAPSGERVVEVSLPEGATVQDALRSAGIELNGREIYVDNTIYELHDEVEDGDIIVLSKKVKAGTLK